MKKETQKTGTVETVKGTAKELNLDFVRMCQRKNKAMEYIASVEQKREGKRQRKIQIIERITNVICLFIIVTGMLFAFAKGSAKQNSIYSMQGSLQGTHVVLDNGIGHNVDESYANYTSEPMRVTVILNDNGTVEADDDIILDIRW